MLRSKGDLGRGSAYSCIGARSRAVFSASLEGGVVSSTKIRLVERGAAELDGAVSVGRSRAGTKASERETGGVSSRLVVS